MNEKGLKKLPAADAEPATAATVDQRPFCTDVSAMTGEFRKMTDRLLVESSTFEEVVETVIQRGGPQLTLAAVRDYFRHNLTLQMQRVRHQKKACEALKSAIGTDTPEGDLAEAAFITGFMSLGRSGSETGLKDTERARLERENLKLRQHVLKLKEARELKERELLSARTTYEVAKVRALKKKVRELRRSVVKSEKVSELSPETIRKIEEIYGLAHETTSIEAAGIEAGD